MDNHLQDFYLQAHRTYKVIGVRKYRVLHNLRRIFQGIVSGYKISEIKLSSQNLFRYLPCIFS